MEMSLSKVNIKTVIIIYTSSLTVGHVHNMFPRRADLSDCLFLLCLSQWFAGFTLSADPFQRHTNVICYTCLPLLGVWNMASDCKGKAFSDNMTLLVSITWQCPSNEPCNVRSLKGRFTNQICDWILKHERRPFGPPCQCWFFEELNIGFLHKALEFSSIYSILLCQLLLNHPLPFQPVDFSSWKWK